MTHNDPYALWSERSLVVFDVETTGVDPDIDRIVEVGAARFERGTLVSQWGSLVNPGRSIPEEAASIHGIRDADVEHAPPFTAAVPYLARIAYGAQPVAYNAPFDQGFLFRDFERTPLDPLYRIPLFSAQARWIDPLAWIRFIRPNNATGNTLAESCERFGAPLVNAHRATDDAIATGHLLFKLVRDIPKMTVCELLRRQQALYEYQQQQYEQWKMRNKGTVATRY